MALVGIGAGVSLAATSSSASGQIIRLCVNARTREVKQPTGTGLRCPGGYFFERFNKHLVPGPRGPAGPQGKQGKTGPQGAPGLSQVQAEEPYGQDHLPNPGIVQSDGIVAPTATTVIWAKCPADLVALGGGFRADANPLAYESNSTPTSDTNAGMRVIASEPSYVNTSGQLVGGEGAPKVGDPDIGNYLPNAWAVSVYNPTSTPQRARVAVVCAAEASNSGS